MNKKSLKLEGWKLKKMGDVGFLQCPYCGYCFEGIGVNKDGTVECYKCKERFPVDELKRVTLKRPVVICKICGAEVSLTQENLDMLGGYSYMCPRCMNHVAIKFKNYVIQPQTVMNLKWNRTIKNRATQIENDLSFATCEDKKDILILKIMQLMAKKEDTGFLYIRENEQKAGLVFDDKKEKYVGFISWTENKNPILRQIFIIKDERRKGYATKVLTFWVDNFSDKISDKFGIESPNEKSQNLLVRLRYAKIEGENIKGLKCFFVSSM
jgi:predicted acetyltransferase